MQQRKDIDSLVKGLENAVADLESSVVALQSPNADLDGVRDLVREADEEMQMTA